MKRLLLALAIQFALPFALAIQAFPIFMPPPSAEGAKAIDIRVDAHDLYLKTSSSEIIRIDKLALLGGKVRASALTLQQWTAIKEPTPDLSLNDRNDGSSTWLLKNQKIRVKHAYCAEGHDDWHALQIDSRKIDTGIESCMALLDPLYFDGKLWFGTSYPGEYADLPGVGILIFDVANRRRFAQIGKALAGGGSGLMRVDADLDGVWVVNDQAIHFFDRSLKRKALAYYSEQFDPTAKNWSQVLISNEHRNHNPFAVAARIIMTPPIESAEADDAYALRLARNRWVTVVGIADYEGEVALLSQRIRSNFWIRYDAFEKQHFPAWGSKPMTKEHGGNEFREASRILSCLYESAGSPQWSPRSLVLNIVAAVEDMNWSDAQLYEPQCKKRSATP